MTTRSSNNKPRQPVPLSQSQLRECREAAVKTRYGAKFVFDVIPFTGLRKSEFLHLRTDWIIWGDGDALNTERVDVIDIPPEAECRHITWKANPPETEPKPGPCKLCQDAGRERWKSHGETPVRQVPVFQSDTQRELRRWFRDLGYDAVPWDPRGLNRLIDDTVAKTNLDREVKPMDLTVTFILIAAERGNFTREEIAEMAGRYKRQGTFNSILRQSSADFDFDLTVPDILTYIDEQQPISLTAMSEDLNISSGAAHSWVHQLVDEGFIQKSQADHEYPANSIVYELVSGVDPDEKLECPDSTCSQDFFNFNTRTQHYEQVHEGKRYTGE